MVSLMNLNRKMTNKKQHGVALLMSLVMLLLITVIGVSAVKISIDDTNIAGNSMYSSLVFQGAESSLNRSADLFIIKQSAEDRTSTVNLSYNDETIVGGGKLNSKGYVKYEGILEGPQINGVANSTEFNYQIFQINAESKLEATSARATHTEGRVIKSPGS